MLNYIRADVKRILGRSSHILSMLLLFCIYFAMLYLPNRSSQMTSVSLVSSACGTLDWLLVFVGLFELIAVFSEDFKVKTMQVAIGLGLTRTQVVICKLLDTVILLVLSCIVILALTVFVGFLLGVTIPMMVLADVIMSLVITGVLANTIYASLTMIVLFVTHSTVLSIFVFCLISIDILNIVLTFAPMFGFKWVDTLNLSHLTLSYLTNAFKTRLALGSVDFSALLGMLVYLGAGVFVTCKLFAKRELDF